MAGTSPVIVVSGLPRSGTSLMMQMLHAGGVDVVTDHVRAADEDNPRGYFEFEQAKRIAHDASWLPHTRGKAFKIVSQLLYHLPPTETYRVIFMRRSLDEMLHSQEKMLQRRNMPAAPREQIREAYTLHLERLLEWLNEQPSLHLLVVHYNELLADPCRLAGEVKRFLNDRPALEPMVRVVDPRLYRNRSVPGNGE